MIRPFLCKKTSPAVWRTIPDIHRFFPRLGFKTMDAFPFLCAVRADASANGDDGGGLPCDVPTRMCLNKLRDIINATSNCNPGCRMLMVQLKMRIWDIHGATWSTALNQLGNWPTSSNTFPMSKRCWACNARFLSSSVKFWSLVLTGNFQAISHESSDQPSWFWLCLATSSMEK